MKLKLLILSLFISLTTSAQIALVAHTFAQCTGSATVSTSALNTVGSNLEVIGVVSELTPGTFSDNLANTWTLAGTAVSTTLGTVNTLKWYFCLNPTTSSTQTFTVGSSANTFPSVFVSTWSSAITSTPIPEQQTSNSALASATVQPGSLTPSFQNELVISVLLSDFTTAGAGSISSPFTLSDSHAPTASAVGGAMAYNIQTTITTVNPTWTVSVVSTLITVQFIFRSTISVTSNKPNFFILTQ